jgi:hypothetical protein
MRRSAIRSGPVLALMSIGIVAACDEEISPRGPGTINVAATVQTQEPLFFQYGIAIDDGSPRFGFASAPIFVSQPGMAPGRHVVTVIDSSVPDVCTGLSPREVNLRGDDTVSVIVQIACGRVTGDIRVVATTTGSDPDDNGYVVLLDSFFAGTVPVNGNVTIGFVQPGPHTVRLTDVASNCTASAQQNITVVSGQLATVNFTITCTPIAVLRFVTSVTGADRDPDGAVVQIDNGAAIRLPIAGTTNVRVGVGTRSYAISDVQPNCTLGGAASGTHTLAGGDTVTINVAETCTAIPAGTAGTQTGTDVAGDTLAGGGGGLPAANDVVGVTARHANGFLMLVVKFSKPVVGGTRAAGLVYGYIDFDVDESAATGIEPASNFFGGNAQMGAEYHIALFDNDTASTELVFTPNETSPFTVVGRVRIKAEADSFVVFMPLNKIGDDGNLAVTMVIGTPERPTDVAPNAGTFVLRTPVAPIIADAALLHREPMAAGRTYTKRPVGKWKVKP